MANLFKLLAWVNSAMALRLDEKKFRFFSSSLLTKPFTLFDFQFDRCDKYDEEICRIQYRIVQTFNVCCLVCTVIFWIGESYTEGINAFDSIAYPILTTFLGTSSAFLGWQQVHPVRLKIAKLLTLAAVTGYVFGHLHVAILDYPFSLSLYSKYSICLWLPGVYALYYGLLGKQYALISCLTNYGLVWVSVGVKTWQHSLNPSVPAAFDFIYVVLFSQLLYIVALSTITTLFETIATANAKSQVLLKAANTDTLTQVLNRRAVNRWLTEMLTQPQNVLVMLVDLDRFKRINDTYGHNAGDQVLIETAQLFNRYLPEDACLGRWGGEEFIIALNEVSMTQGVRLAETLRSGLEKHNYPEVGRVTASFGVTHAHPGDTPETLIARADEALYAAKQTRNAVKIQDRLIDQEGLLNQALLDETQPPAKVIPVYPPDRHPEQKLSDA